MDLTQRLLFLLIAVGLCLVVPQLSQAREVAGIKRADALPATTP
jgi:hypothetical protein